MRPCSCCSPSARARGRAQCHRGDGRAGRRVRLARRSWPAWASAGTMEQACCWPSASCCGSWARRRRRRRSPRLEGEALARLNATGIGPLGLGGADDGAGRARRGRAHAHRRAAGCRQSPMSCVPARGKDALMAALSLELPLSQAALARLRSGDTVLLSGELYTARDAAHRRFAALLARGEPLPVPPGCCIYYAVPAPPRRGDHRPVRADDRRAHGRLYRPRCSRTASTRSSARDRSGRRSSRPCAAGPCILRPRAAPGC